VDQLDQGPLQRVSRLAPLTEILAYLDESVRPVTPLDLAPPSAVGCVLACDVVATTQWPPQALATRDGWAVSSEQVLDASAYTPVLLDPSARWIEVGEPLPSQADAVLRGDDVTQTQAGPETSAPVTAGDGVAGAGAEVAKGLLLRRAGQRLRASDAAVLISCGMNSVAVRRPTVGVVSTSMPAFAATDSVSPVVLRLVEKVGGTVEVVRSTHIEEALRNERVDAVFAIGGTGAGRQDSSVDTLARIGKLVWHGLGIAPGESAALGVVQGRPVLLLPGRFDAALAALLIVGTGVLGRLAGRRKACIGRQAKLTRKVTSTIGLAEVMLLRCVPDGVEPLAAGALTLQALAQADGWGVVAPESEGLAAGSMVEIRPLP
jgi:molybdopterin molybdotransferase